MTVMVTGGSGHVGAYVLNELIERGETPLSFDIEAPPKELGDKAKFFRGDVSSVTDLLSAIKENKVTRIIHLACLLTASSQQYPVKAYHINIGGTLNVLESARIMDVERVVYSSSLAAYGPTPEGQPVPENHPKEPTSITEPPSFLMRVYYLPIIEILILTSLPFGGRWYGARAWKVKTTALRITPLASFQILLKTR